MEVTSAPLELSTSPRLDSLLGELDVTDRTTAKLRQRLARRRGAVAAASVLVVGGTILLMTRLSAAAVNTGALAVSVLRRLVVMGSGAYGSGAYRWGKWAS